MISGFIERCLRIVAEAVPARIAYFVALRVLCHASFKAFAKVPVSQIKALDALSFWHVDKLERKPRVRGVAGKLKAVDRPSGPPIWTQSGTDGMTVKPRQLGPGEMLAEGEIVYTDEAKYRGDQPGDRLKTASPQ